MRLMILTFGVFLWLPIGLGAYWYVTRIAQPSEVQVARFVTSSGNSRWGSGYMPNLPVVDQDGKSYRFYDDLIKGKKVIINFIYTSCSSICPLTTSRMALLQERLGDTVGRDYFMYSITVDPFHDGPAELKAYANSFNVKPGWRFLTGTPGDIEEIRNKLGERTKELKDHKQEVLLGNDTIGSWSRDSVLGDLEGILLSIHGMDPSVPVPGVVRATGDTQMVQFAPGEALFARMCASCHTVGYGQRVGPDLNGVTQRRDRTWLEDFISAPDQMFARNDPLAMELAQKYPAVRMPDLGLSRPDAQDVISYLEKKSAVRH